jgi:hypothetical protein
VPAVGLVGGRESFGKAGPGLVVRLADLGVQRGDDGLELGAGLQEFQALGDQQGI